jgi:hypothetical protein
VLRSLRDGELRSTSCLQHLACTGVNLPAHEEWDEHFGVVAKVVISAREIVLVAPIAIASRISVIAKEVDISANSFFVEPFLSRLHELLKDPLPCLVMGHEVIERVTFSGGILRVRADVQIQTCPICKENIGGPPPRNHPAKQVAGNLVWAQPALASQSASDSVLIFESVDAPVHMVKLQAVITD